MNRTVALVLACAGLWAMAPNAHAVAPADTVRAAGNWGVGLGGGTAVGGISGKLFLSKGTALQGVVGGAGYTNPDFGTTALGVDIDFLLEMRANTDWQDIPVIVLTAKDLTDEDRRVLSGRVEQIVEKGACAHDQVVNLIHKVLDPAPAVSKAAAPAQ